MPSNQPVKSTTHPVLGPGTAIYDNRGRTRLRRNVYVLMVPLGLFGIWLGRGDIASGSTLTGAAQALAGVILACYSLRAAWADSKRLANPVRLVIARDGFAVMPEDRPILWREIESVGDPRSPANDPRTLRVQLSDPDDFERSHSLPLWSRMILRFNRGDLVLGSGMAIPILNAQTLMHDQLTAFRRKGSATAAKPLDSRAQKARRTPRKR